MRVNSGPLLHHLQDEFKSCNEESDDDSDENLDHEYKPKKSSVADPNRELVPDSDPDAFWSDDASFEDAPKKRQRLLLTNGAERLTDSTEYGETGQLPVSSMNSDNSTGLVN